MQTPKSIVLTAPPSQNVIAFLHCSESDRTSGDIDPETSVVLAEIAADRDYYESCGRW